MLGDMLRDDASFEDFVATQDNNWSLNLAMVIRPALTLLLCLLLAAWMLRLYRASCAAWAPASEQYRLQYRAALDTLSAVGIYRRFGESREAFARRNQTQFPAFVTLTRAHLNSSPGYACRPGIAAMTADTTAEHDSQPWHQWRKQLAGEVTQTIPWWRRLLAWVHPAPWLYSR